MGRGLHASETRSINFYDSVDIAEIRQFGNPQIFGNRNVGYITRTNLQVPGQLAYDQSVILQRWYARTNLPEHGRVHDAFVTWAHTVPVTFIMGMKPQWQLSLYELCERRPRTSDDEIRGTQPCLSG